MKSFNLAGLMILLAGSASASVTFKLETPDQSDCVFSQTAIFEMTDAVFSSVRITNANLPSRCGKIPNKATFTIVGSPVVDEDHFLNYRTNWSADGWMLQVQDRRKSDQFLGFGNRAALRIRMVNKDGRSVESFTKVTKECADVSEKISIADQLLAKVSEYTQRDTHYAITPVRHEFVPVSSSTTIVGSGVYNVYAPFKLESGCLYLKEENLEKMNPMQSVVCQKLYNENTETNRTELLGRLSDRGFISPSLTFFQSAGEFYADGSGYGLRCWVGADMEDFGPRCSAEIGLVCKGGLVDGCDIGRTSYHRCVPKN